MFCFSVKSRENFAVPPSPETPSMRSSMLSWFPFDPWLLLKWEDGASTGSWAPLTEAGISAGFSLLSTRYRHPPPTGRSPNIRCA